MATATKRKPQSQAEPKEPKGSKPVELPRVQPKKNPFVMFFNLGAFLAGCTAGYFFCKAENKFTRYGEGLVIQMLKSLRRGRGDGDEGFPRTDRFSGARKRWSGDPDFDPMGDDSGPDFQGEEDREQL